MQNRIIVPAHYDVDVLIKFDPIKGQTELQIRNRGKIQVSMWQVAALLAEHASSLIKSLISGQLKVDHVAEATETKPANGGDSNAS
jgi:hypothetical protein